MSARWITADVFDGLAMLDDDSVDLIFTSPPFLALRSYLPADHPDKGKEIGSEATPAAFLDALLDVVEACDRVLAPHGTLCFELGDTYSGSGGAGGGYADQGLRDGQPKFGGSASRGRLAEYTDDRGNPDGMRDTTFSGGNTRTGGGSGWPLAKSLTGIPDAFALSLEYGRNILRPERETPRWRVRNKIPWCRPNPPVGALGDKWRPATSYVTVACKARDRWFDLDAVRGEPGETARKYREEPTTTTGRHEGFPGEDRPPYTNTGAHPNGAPPLDWVELDEDTGPDYLVLPTAPYKGAHYATFPEALVRPFVESCCPREVCRVCGKPRRRITKTEYKSWNDLPYRQNLDSDQSAEPRATALGRGPQAMPLGRADKFTTTLGWSDCGHDNYRRGVVLDPFAGSGTTLAVAEGCGRDSIGIDIDARNLELARARCGMFLEETAA